MVALCSALALALALVGAGRASAASAAPDPLAPWVGPAVPAHGDGGLLAVEAAHPTPTGFHYIVRLTYQADGHAVSGATVTATPVAPDGTEGEPVTLAPYDDDGRYQGAIDMTQPGSWTVRFASADPEAAAEATAEIETPATTDPDAPDGGATGFAPADDGTGLSAAEEDESGGDGDDGGSSFPILLVVVAAVVAIGGLFTALRTIGRTRSGPAGSGGSGGAAAAPPHGGAEGAGDAGAGPVDGTDGAGAAGDAGTSGSSAEPPDGAGDTAGETGGAAPVGGAGDAGDAGGGDGG
ncbi:MAG TPA: FixH family protein [Acidimicrobiales bacterium]